MAQFSHEIKNSVDYITCDLDELRKNASNTEVMIVPMSLCQLFEMSEILCSIVSLRGQIKENFEKEEQAFIAKYWPDRLDVKDKIIQLAIYVSMCRLSGTAALGKEYNKFGYWDTPYDDLKNEKIAVWCNNDAPYVFRSLSRRVGRMRHDSIKDLLICHKHDESIKNKMDALSKLH